jgi:hypothetical protein
VELFSLADQVLVVDPVGFGLDSAVEVTSALAVAWQFSGGDREAREKTALGRLNTRSPASSLQP